MIPKSLKKSYYFYEIMKAISAFEFILTLK